MDERELNNDREHRADRRLEALRRAELVIDHATSTGVTFAPEEIEPILCMRAVIERQDGAAATLPPADEAKFWAAAAKMTRDVRPATIEAIWERREFLERARRSGPALARAAGPFRYLVWLLLPMTLLLHAWQVSLDTMVNRAHEARVAYDAGRAEIVRARAALETATLNGAGGVNAITLAATSTPAPIPQRTEADLVPVTQAVINGRERMCAAAMDWDVTLTRLNGLAPPFGEQLNTLLSRASTPTAFQTQLPCAEVTDVPSLARKLHMAAFPSHEAVRLLVDAETYRDVLAKFVLPFLYGTLGAVAAAMRALTSSIREVRFSRGSNVEYVLRVPLGALAGATVGLVIAPESLITVAGVTSLGLAFGIGYSVDVFFSFLDGIVNRLTGKEAARSDAS